MPPGNAHLWGTVCLLVMLGSPAFAQQPDEAELPSLEFLEFLGDWETEDGEWIDPEELEEIALSDPEQNYEDEPQK